ncbi:LuxR C-terminal-related transcriptional regulator [Bradyrhizobium sp. JYMT SZCCT0428]|uniref:LuxR C-terminal-related transcriptional regulator n=1 Tax=Bradyrhizobium sp. JYMT SZCCT0428 TaxID=2807673 RepID=UPI001BA5AAF9|nr:LuxR C-terminal-related transcriptional regulator [Bradyrhizobium sp. JYMT SZCCT0428]MBR1156631.1 hypothetical protein [Bradyrhizobium sp. JYMT SZCCT0428]
MTDLIAEDFSVFEGQSGSGSARGEGQTSLLRPCSPHVIRRRLSFLLPADGGPPLTMVTTPYGFGKSGLIYQWISQLNDNHVPVGLVLARPGEILYGMASKGTTWQFLLAKPELVSTVVDRWTTSTPNIFVLIDDAHELPDHVAADLCTNFLQRMEQCDHSLIIASRRPLRVALARARALGKVRELQSGDLKLDSEELAQLVTDRLGITIDPATLRDLTDATAGWPAAASLALRRAQEIGLVTAIAELKRGTSLIDDLFEEEVFRPLPTSLREFLLDASAFGTLNSTVLDDVLGVDNSWGRLDELIRSGLFVESFGADRGEYRLHPLFCQFLAAQLTRANRERYVGLAQRAAAWFERHDRLPEAFDCLVRAESWDTAAALLDRFSSLSYLSGAGTLITAMALRLPEDALRKYPRAAVFAARGASTDWRFGLVEKFLGVARTATAEAGAHELENLVLHSQMLRSQYEDDQIEAGRLCEELLKRSETLDHFTLGTIYGSLLYARREQFDLADAIELEQAAVREFNLTDRPLGLVYHLSVAGPTLALKGDLNAGARRLELASETANRLIDAKWIEAIPGLLLAEVLYERNDLHRSSALLEKYDPAPPIAFIDQYIAAYTTSTKLLSLAGNIAGAHQRLDEGMILAESRGLGRLRSSVVNERIRLLLTHGARDEAIEVGRQENLLVSPEQVLPRPRGTTRDEIRATSWFRLALVSGQFEKALVVGQSWKRFLTRSGAYRAVMRWELLLAQVHASMSQDARAHRELRSALSRGVAGGFFRSFLDEGSIVERLLREQLDASAIRTNPSDLLVERLVRSSFPELPQTGNAARRAEPERDGVEPLSRTQIEILQMASAGLLNREIAHRVGMTEGSVKWYMQQIFNKIGVRRRAGALDRARALGLLG